jgi:hypothetical protein
MLDAMRERESDEKSPKTFRRLASEKFDPMSTRKETNKNIRWNT